MRPPVKGADSIEDGWRLARRVPFVSKERGETKQILVALNDGPNPLGDFRKRAYPCRMGKGTCPSGGTDGHVPLPILRLPK